MKLGLQINRFDFESDTRTIGANLKIVAQAAEKAGIDSLWVMDHFFQLPGLGRPEEPMMEAYTTLGYLAGVTSRIKLGTLVTGVIYREPALLIKAVTALDVVSGGRAYFALGAGWYEEEAKALGFLDPLTSQRFERLEETLKIARQMWSGNTEPFHGTHYRLEGPINSPSATTRPHPPILIGGGGEQKTLRLVAEYGDACNLFANDLKTLAYKLDVLKGHCQELSRDYDEIEKTALASAYRVNDVAAKPDEALEHCRKLANLGIQHVIIGVSRDLDSQAYDQLAKTVAAIHEL
jgi:F420-dependent oxidoreductase-like protein